MSSGRLQDLCQVVDCEHKTGPEAAYGSEYAYSVGTPALRGSNIDFSQAKRVDRATYEAWSRRAELKAGDIVLAREAPVGGVGYVDGSKRVCLGQRTVLVRVTSADLDSRFLFFALQSPAVQRWMGDRSSGSTVAHLNVADVRELPLPFLPPLAEQRRIAGVLGALDDLIETNQRLMGHLDDAFLASWLKISGESPEVTTIGEHALASKGLSYKGAFLADTGLPMINLGSFGVDGRYKPSGIKFYAEGEVKERHRLLRGDLVVANTDLTQVRDILGRAVLVPFDQATSTHHTFQIQVPAGEAVRNWIFASLRQDSVRQRLISYATGTTVAALPADALLTQEIPWAPTAVIENWFESAKHYLIARDELAEEAQQLSQTRDELLPLLLSGRVSVREVAA